MHARGSMKLGRSICLFVVVCVSLTMNAAHATTWYVDDDSPCPGSGTQADPFCAIHFAILAGYHGDQIIVSPGTYDYCEIWDLDSVDIISTDGPEVTIIDGGGSEWVFYARNAIFSSITGFTITGGDSSWGAIGSGVRIEDSVDFVVTDCIIKGNSALRGGGVHCIDSTATLNDCIIQNNHATEVGGGVDIDDCFSVQMFNCIINGNTADLHGAGLAVGWWTLYSSTVDLFNCTIVSNDSAGLGGGVYCEPAPQLTAKNTIIWGNTDSVGSASASQWAGNGYLYYSLLQGGWYGDGSNNILANPDFVDFLGGDGIPGTGDEDLRLLPASPAIDAGDSTDIDAVTDLDGNPRLVDDTGTLDTGVPSGGAVVDLGAYEFQGTTPPQDCNTNGVPDFDDITAATSEDCNANGVPDECEIVVGDVVDCDSDLIPDVCEIAETPVFDLDSDGYLDICQGNYVKNITSDSYYGGVTEAIAGALDGHDLLAQPEAFTNEPSFDFIGKGISLTCVTNLTQSAGELITMADDAKLAAYDTMTFGGELRVLFGDRADLQAADVLVDATGTLHIETAAILNVSTGDDLNIAGVLNLLGGALGSDGPLTISTGTLTAYGNIQADIVNGHDAVFIADTQINGDYLNNGTTTVQNGTLTIVGALTNNGTIIGDVSHGRSTPGLTVLGDYALGSTATLTMPAGAVVRVEGDFDCSVDSNIRYGMANAELRMIGLNSALQELEMMSLDVSADPAGLDRTLPGHYPIGTLRIGPSGTTVDLVDHHDNDGLGQSLCEAVYIDHLIIDAGAHLNTNGCPVYYSALTLDGTVDVETNLILIPMVDDLFPVAVASIQDSPRDGLGDIFNNEPFEGLVRQTSTVEDRAIAEFDVSAYAGMTIVSANISGHMAINNGLDVGPRTFDFLLYDGNGIADLSDFEIPATWVGSDSYHPPTDTFFDFEFDVTATLQSLIDGGASYVGLKCDPTSDPNYPNLLSATMLTISAVPGAPCPWDTAPIGGDDTVGLGDLNALLSNWGSCAPPCPWDFAPEEGDGTVGLGDLNALLSNWGPCP